MTTEFNGDTGADTIKDGAVATTAKLADAIVTPAKLTQPLTLGTAQNTTSGTSIDFTGIPSWVKRVTVMFSGVSTNGTSNLMLQLGTGSFTSSGYSSTSSVVTTAVSSTLFTTGFGITQSNAAVNSNSGMMTLTLLSVSSNTWQAQGAVATVGAAQQYVNVGAVTLSGALDRLRLTTFGGTDTFDAGSVNILYEG